MKSFVTFTAAAWLGCVAIFAATQAEEKFKTRLAPVAMDIAMQAKIAGSGSASAVLSGNKLSVSGSFEGLLSPATDAHLHQGLATGVRGPAVLDLTVSHAASGTVTGSFELAPEQVENLKKGRLYIQINSEKAPEGNLWGWLLK
jgi:CHRD domain-containing protein